MKTFLKKIIGRTNFRKIKRLVKNVPFSESDLILDYFETNSRNGIMFDVGVHWGESFIDYAENNWKIIGFEPDSENISHIPAYSNFKLYQNAVSDEDDLEVNLFKSEESSGISSLIPFHHKHKIAGTVKTITLTTAIDKEKITNLDFLKIDIEGYDFFALKGFPFNKLKPEIILCEFEDIKTMRLGYDYKDMGNFLINKGYRVWLSEWSPVIKYGTCHSWLDIRSYYTELSNENGWGNFIAVTEDNARNFERVLQKYLTTISK